MTNLTGIVLDVVLVALVALGAWRGARKGLVLTLCGLLAIVVAYAGAIYVSQEFSDGLSAVLQPAVEERLQNTLNKALEEGAGQGEGSGDSVQSMTVDQILDVVGDSRLFGIALGSLREELQQGVNQTASTAITAVSAAVAGYVARMILFSVAFLLVLLAWTLLSHILDLACRLPVLHALNKLLGALAGGVQVLVILFAVGWILRVLAVVPPAAVETSHVARFFLQG